MTDYVTERELTAHLDPMKSDIAEIKSDVKSIVSHNFADQWFGGKGHAVLVVGLPIVISALTAIIIAIFIAN